MAEEHDPAATQEREFANAVANASVGDKMPDGTIYLGRHAGNHWFAAAQDIKHEDGDNLLMTFAEAAAHVIALDVHGHADWQLPPGKNAHAEPNIVEAMFDHRRDGAFNGTYHEVNSATRAGSPGWYWSGKDGHDVAWAIRFADGFGGWLGKDDLRLSCRPVRCAPAG